MDMDAYLATSGQAQDKFLSNFRKREKEVDLKYEALIKKIFDTMQEIEKCLGNVQPPA
jgi:hypothetical protein